MPHTTRWVLAHERALAAFPPVAMSGGLASAGSASNGTGFGAEGAL